MQPLLSRQFHVLALLLFAALLPSSAAAQNGVAFVPMAVHSADPYSSVSQAAGTFPSLGGGLGSVNFGQGIIPSPMVLSERLWVRAEYLYWKTEGMDVPPLVTTSPATTSQFDAGVLGEPGTKTLFGGGEINGGGVSGVRLKSGFWLTQQGTFAIEGEYFQLLGDQDDGFSGGGGTSIIARPFYDSSRDVDTAQLINFPNVVDGTLRIATDSDLKSMLINGRVALCPVGVCNANGLSDRVDWIVGYRYLDLDDSITFSEPSLDSQLQQARGTISLNDRFTSSNEFHGLQLGVVHQTQFKRGWLESMLRVAAGNTKQEVNISGNTSITENGTTDNYSNGLFAQRSNIGKHERDQFTMIPEVGLTLGIRLTDWLDATVGYSVMYFPSVVRAGTQIDTDVNSNLIAPEAAAPVGTLRPGFEFVESDYWAHGLNLGAELRF
ncbi:BBP7 family outer membrane beta-barrel protein [Rubripirellula amarantea]|nr:BBP7 family outer membrane beta-barrel protein [Rubripirellula amarantea]